MHAPFLRLAGGCALVVLLAAGQADALSIREFRKHPDDQQAVYVTAAVSMIAYNQAVVGDVDKARCIRNWYFGERGEETPGPRQIAIEMQVAERQDPDKYHVEGVILGVIDNACSEAARAARRP